MPNIDGPHTQAPPQQQAGEQHADDSSTVSTQSVQSGRRLLYLLMLPVIATMLNFTAFGVALPTLRDEFGIGADLAAWLVIAYTLPFMVLVPLYGRLGDGLGKRNLITIGLGIFIVGTGVAMTARGMGWLMLARIIQGAGLAGMMPLCIAIISERFAPSERGRALGFWNSVGPLFGIAGPVIAGLIIDQWGWRMIFIPALLAGIIAFVAVYIGIPSLRRMRIGFLRHFDWLGAGLLAVAIISFVAYVSSRPITGVAPLRDWRLFLISIVATGAFVLREDRTRDPFLHLALFLNRSLITAAVISGLRMFTMSGVGFLMPLYLADVHGLSATATGVILMLNAAALFATMRLGGQLGDRWGSRIPVMIGLSIQAAVMLYFALIPATVSLVWVAAGLIVHGLAAGLSLASLHRAAMSDVDNRETGAAAGVYSMIRFSGLLMGAALGGVLLQQALDTRPTAVAYQMVFAIIAAAALGGALTGSLLKA